MKKIVVIGDIHSRTIWKQIVHNNPNVDYYVFLGDYVDPYPFESQWDKKVTNYSFKETITNLKEIIEFKKQNSEKVILLIGNHDAHYLFDVSPCSRYDKINAKEIKKIFQENEKIFTFAFQIKNYLFTHAGVTLQWFDYCRVIMNNLGLLKDKSNLAEVINRMSVDFLDTLAWCNYIRGGYNPCSGILWADAKESFQNIIKDIHQYVGHSKVSEFTLGKMDENTSIIYCDVLHKAKENLEDNYLVVEI